MKILINFISKIGDDPDYPNYTAKEFDAEDIDHIYPYYICQRVRCGTKIWNQICVVLKQEGSNGEILYEFFTENEQYYVNVEFK